METSSTHPIIFSRLNPWGKLWKALSLLVLFLVAMMIVVRWNPNPIGKDHKRTLERIKNLAALRKSNQERLSSYGWVDQAHGIVHLPIERAVELETASLNDPQWKPKPAYEIAPIDLVPKPAGMPMPPTPASTPVIK